MSVHAEPFERRETRRSKAAPKVDDIVADGVDIRKFVENFEVLAEAAGGIEQLRRGIRDLAVCGRLLVPHVAIENTSESDASVDVAFDIPTHWRWRPLGALVERTDYGTSQKAHEEPHGVPVLRMNNIQNGRLELSPLKYVPDTTEKLADLLLLDGDLLFNRTNSYELVGKMGVFRAEGRYTFASYLIRVRVSQTAADPEFINIYFGSGLCRRTQIEPNITVQTNQANFNGTKLKAIAVPVPPLAEQKRIVAKVDQLMALCDELEARQTKKRETSARLTKSVLEALTTADGPEEFDAAWNRVVENFDVVVGNAGSVALVRQTLVDLAVGRLPSTQGETDVPLLSLRELATDTRYGTARKCDRNANNVPVLRIPNVVRGTLDLEDLKYTHFAPAELEELRLKTGDVLVVRSNGSRELVGRACVVDERAVGFAFAGYLIRIRLHHDVIRPAWLRLAMQSSGVRAAIEGPARTTSGVHNVNTKELLALEFPVPTIATQETILRSIERLLHICDDLEARFRRAEDRATKLVEAAVKELVV